MTSLEPPDEAALKKSIEFIITGENHLNKWGTNKTLYYTVGIFNIHIKKITIEENNSVILELKKLIGKKSYISTQYFLEKNLAQTLVKKEGVPILKKAKSLDDIAFI